MLDAIGNALARYHHRAIHEDGLVGPGPGLVVRARVARRGRDARDLERGLAELVEEPLRAFHALVKLAWALAPEMVLLYDVDACAAHHTAWTKETAESGALPAPQALFTNRSQHVMIL